jgi:4-hydroxy-tetrahydrodipicolinate synthase
MHTIDTVYCAAITPMNYDQSVDLAGLVRNIRWYREQGLGGVLVCGGTGEFVSLTFEERQAVVAAAAREIAGQCGFMVGCAAETTREAVLHAQHAQVCGADGLLLIAPYYFKPSKDELAAHMRAVARAVSIPVVLYNNPGACGSDLTPEIIADLASGPNIAGVKEATGDLRRVDEIRRLCPEDFRVVCGCDYLACDILEKGGAGWISITANALPARPSTSLTAPLR